MFIHSHSSLKTIPDSRPKWAKCVLVFKIEKIGAKTIPDGAANTYMAYIREYPPPPGASKEEQDKPTRQQVISETLIWRNHIYDVVILRPTFVAPFSDRDHLGFRSIYLATLRLPFIDRELTNRRLSHDATAGSCHSSALPSCRNLNLRFVVKTTTLVRAAGKFSRRFWSLFSSFHK